MQALQFFGLRPDGRYMIVVHDNPADYPGQFVGVVFMTREAQEPVRVPAVMLGKSLEEIRAQIPEGFVPLARHPEDVPSIVEVWI